VSQPCETGAWNDRPWADAPAERLAIAGSGAVACGLAACAAARGCEVVLWARSSPSANRATEAVASTCERLGSADSAGRVRIERALEALREGSLAVEAVSEDEVLKREVLGSLGGLLADDAIIATTTSSLRISTLAEACGRPARFLGLHVFNPVHRMPLVEICLPPGADSDARARAIAFCSAIGKTAVEVPDETGFVVNRLLFPYLFDAVRLLERTGLEPEQIDTCMKLGASHPMGPLELLDLIGLDVAAAIGEAIHAQSGEPGHRPPERVRELLGEGKLGQKSGAGFYRYES
jgi:3-hydroxybutyryl-CoA dehydrogenase